MVRSFPSSQSNSPCLLHLMPTGLPPSPNRYTGPSGQTKHPADSPILPPSTPPAAPQIRPPVSPMPLPPFDFGYQRPTADPDDCLLMPNAPHCKLENGVDYCTVVQAVNAHGLLSERKRSSGVRVCFAPPNAGLVYEVSVRDAQWNHRDRWTQERIGWNQMLAAFTRLHHCPSIPSSLADCFVG